MKNCYLRQCYNVPLKNKILTRKINYDKNILKRNKGLQNASFILENEFCNALKDILQNCCSVRY